MRIINLNKFAIYFTILINIHISYIECNCIAKESTILVKTSQSVKEIATNTEASTTTIQSTIIISTTITFTSTMMQITTFPFVTIPVTNFKTSYPRPYPKLFTTGLSLTKSEQAPNIALSTVTRATIISTTEILSLQTRTQILITTTEFKTEETQPARTRTPAPNVCQTATNFYFNSFVSVNPRILQRDGILIWKKNLNPNSRLTIKCACAIHCQYNNDCTYFEALRNTNVCSIYYYIYSDYFLFKGEILVKNTSIDCGFKF